MCLYDLFRAIKWCFFLTQPGNLQTSGPPAKNSSRNEMISLRHFQSQQFYALVVVVLVVMVREMVVVVVVVIE